MEKVMRAACRTLALAVAVGVPLLLSSPAGATIITRDYAFTTTTPGPITSQGGTFSIAFDDVANTATLEAVDIPIGSTTFTLANTGMEPHFTIDLLLGGLVNGVDGLANGVNTGKTDFALDFTPRLHPVFRSFIYTVGGQDGMWQSLNGTIRVTNNPVPEPGSWALLFVGLSGLGGALRFARRSRARPDSATA
jgi:hypothetical protein